MIIVYLVSFCILFTHPNFELILISKALQQKIQMLESENQKMHSEFNMQRAKLKELYVQKETEFVKCSAEKSALQRELDEMRSQFLVADLKSESEMQLKDSRAQEEIASLQQLVQGKCK